MLSFLQNIGYMVGEMAIKTELELLDSDCHLFGLPACFYFTRAVKGHTGREWLRVASRVSP